MKRQTCPYCGGPATIRDSALIYGRSYGMALICDRYPECDSYVGCHRGTNRPLGTLANAALRAARNGAHVAFDPIWRSGRMGRRRAYSWLAQQLGIGFDDCHVAMFDLATCRRVVEVCEALKSSVTAT